jgi:hypothetical protein
MVMVPSQRSARQRGAALWQTCRSAKAAPLGGFFIFGGQQMTTSYRRNRGRTKLRRHRLRTDIRAGLRLGELHRAHIVTVIGHRLEFFHAGPARVIGINRTVPFVVPYR